MGRKYAIGFFLLFLWIAGGFMAYGEVAEEGKLCHVFLYDAEAHTERGWLGIALRDLTKEERDAVGGRGVAILQVMEESPAEEVGLLAGDFIIRIDGKEIEGSKDFIAMMRAHRPGDSIALVIRRDTDEFTVGPVLTERPEKVSFSFFGLRRKGYLGISPIEMTAELREHYGAPRDAGILIGKVVEESPADKAGLRVGDVLVEVDGVRIGDTHDLYRMIREKEEGKEVEIVFYRNKRERTVTAIIEEKEVKQFNLGKMGIITIPEIDIPEIHIPEIDIEMEEIEPIVIRSVERLRHLLESEEYQEKLEEFRKLEGELQEKIRMLEKRLRELEKRLRAVEEEPKSL